MSWSLGTLKVKKIKRFSNEIQHLTTLTRLLNDFKTLTNCLESRRDTKNSMESNKILVDLERGGLIREKTNFENQLCKAFLLSRANIVGQKIVYNNIYEQFSYLSRHSQKYRSGFPVWTIFCPYCTAGTTGPTLLIFETCLTN